LYCNVTAEPLMITVTGHEGAAEMQRQLDKGLTPADLGFRHTEAATAAD
jgi:hypothetical protein